MKYFDSSEICNSKPQCEELSKIIREMCPKAEVVCHTGRRGNTFKPNVCAFHSKS